MTQNRKTLLALADRLDRELNGVGLNPYTNVRVVSLGLIDDLLRELRATASSLEVGK